MRRLLAVVAAFAVLGAALVAAVDGPGDGLARLGTLAALLGAGGVAAVAVARRRQRARYPSAPLFPAPGADPGYSIERWEEIFTIDPEDHSRHTSVTRLRLKAVADSLPGFYWFVHYSGDGERSRPAIAGPPQIEGAELTGHVPADQGAPGWTGGRLKFSEPLSPEDDPLEVSIVQTFHDSGGRFRPIFHVDAATPAKQLIVRVRFPANAVPSKICAYATGPGATEVYPWQRQLAPVTGMPLVEAVMKVEPTVPRGEYWMTWDAPATGTRMRSWIGG